MEKAALFVLLIFPVQLMCLWVTYRAGKLKEREGWNTVMNLYKQEIIDQTHTIADLHQQIHNSRVMKMALTPEARRGSTERVECDICGTPLITERFLCDTCRAVDAPAEEV